MLDVEVLFILVSTTVTLRGHCSSLLSSSTLDFTISSRWGLFIVSKAADLSMPEISIVVSSCYGIRLNTSVVRLRSDGTLLEDEPR